MSSGTDNGRRRGAWTHWLVLAGSLGLTVAATVFVAVSARGRDDARFANAVQSATDRIAGRLDIYTATLRGGAALFAATPADREAFHHYVERLEIQRWYPGVQGIGWSPRIAAGLPGEPDERYAIEYLEPLDARNRAALGYDMYSEPTRREAMQRARDLGGPALSGRVTLVQEIAGPAQPGFLIYVPVYAGGSTPATVEERRAALLGFVYAPFRAHDLFAGVFGREAQPRVSFSVYDGNGIDTAALLFASDREPGHRPRNAGTMRLLNAGQPWTIAFESQPDFEAGSTRRFVPMVLAAGLLASLWLFALARGQARARAVAEDANQAKSDFLATMSHELRTPLNAIGGYVELIQIGIAGSVSERQQQYLDRVQRAQQHLLGLINNVLNYARVDAGRVEYTITRVDIAEEVADSLSLVSVQAEKKDISVRNAAGPAVSIDADVEKLRQILLNLLSNSVKFTEPGGSIETRWRVNGERIEIAVADTGIGIAKERLDTIFEPFVQVDPDLTRVRHGAGLGLSISRDLARGMDGDITVRSRAGAGSTFVLSLPLRADGGR
jgi:signal transduction histidine kinase